MRTTRARPLFPAKEFAPLYAWAIRYARCSKCTLVEVEDLIQEMLLAAGTASWKGAPYARQVMRNRLVTLVRKAQVQRRYHLELDESVEQDFYFSDEDGFEARDLLAHLMNAVTKKNAAVLNHLLVGRTVNEISKLERISLRMVYKYISHSKDILIYLYK